MSAATEETTSGRHRLLDELAGRIPFPVIVINDSPIKLKFENEHGIGPAVVDGFLRATNNLVAAKTFAVVGFGSCGRSLARTLRALGASVIVVERDPVRALEAAFEGMRVTSIDRAAERADVLITVTGRPNALTTEAHDARCATARCSRTWAISRPRSTLPVSSSLRSAVARSARM